VTVLYVDDRFACHPKAYYVEVVYYMNLVIDYWGPVRFARVLCYFARKLGSFFCVLILIVLYFFGMPSLY